MPSFLKNFGLFLSALVASLIVLSPSYRGLLWRLSDNESRQILGTLNFHTDHSQYKIVKIRKQKHILVEIYKVRAEENYYLVDSFEIPDSRDVFYDFKTSATNLFSANIDSEEGEEVIIPVLDANMVAHMNIIKFDPQTKNFSHYSYRVN
jgi:hypothetical protein